MSRTFLIYPCSKELTAETFGVFPNPSTGMYTLRFGDAGQYKVLIMDLLGRKVREFTTDKKELTFDLTPEPKGTFIIQVEGNNRQFRKKIVKL